ncbi:hypothetical protein [Mesorhizobium sp. M7A.F.Ca.US.008.03.1.1]|uniref:hypothetical protein n=1 Tax=Mesorhizobium sp. M7A.F.Ca.US.008.03.1.1 TaxID=2496742 RepID=UPI000FCAC5F0|nr:hypothetical protein [Mesorhizobium sp. M7A.F.Ca.US.008.03.1.1]RUW61450.1 hypothetical protein EOA16_14045 [Mesorhizobium sp. M7A.F.Ca.US.008.03.1.1]
MEEQGGGTPPTATVHPSTRHLLIAGTGRAGTSFLVRYLTELGLDTTLSRRGEAGAFWDDLASAGLEEHLAYSGAELPYVVKSPWIGEHIEQILSNPRLAVDAILVPVRDLMEAAASRAILEMRAIHEHAPWMAEMDRSWEVWGTTPGGMVYSLNPLDQARLLAFSFHNLVWRATEAEVPVHFLAFPRMVEDKEYLLHALRPILPHGTTAERAYQAHARTADLTKIRVGKEMMATVNERRVDAASAHRAAQSMRPEEVDMLALRRELGRVRKDALQSERKVTEVQAALSAESARTAGAAGEIAELRAALWAERAHVAQAAGEIAELRTANSAERAHVAQAVAEIAELRTALSAESARAEQATGEARALLSSRSWRITAPLRALLTGVRRKSAQ